MKDAHDNQTIAQAMSTPEVQEILELSGFSEEEFLEMARQYLHEMSLGGSDEESSELGSNDGIDEVLAETFPVLNLSYVVGLEERMHAEQDPYEIPQNVRSPEYSEMEPELCGDNLVFGYDHVYFGRQGFKVHDADGIGCFYSGPYPG